MWKRFALITLFLILHFNHGNASFCDKIKQKYLSKSYVSEEAKAKNISLYWGSDPSRVAAKLFDVLLRHVLGYQNVRLQQGPLDLKSLVKEVGFDKTGKYDNVVLALSAAWLPAPAPSWRPYSGTRGGLADPRLQEFGASLVPAHQRLFVHKANQDSTRQCANINQWSFYTDVTSLTDCGFLETTKSGDRVWDVYEMDGSNTIIKKTLTARAEAYSMKVQFKNLNRQNLFQRLQAGNESFLFTDYDIWANYTNIKAVQLPPCILTASMTCQQELDISIGMRIGDVSKLQEFAPQLLELAYNFSPSLETIRFMLEQDSYHKNIEEKACKWAFKNNATVNTWLSKKVYYILIFYCNDDPYLQDFDKLINQVFFGKPNNTIYVFELHEVRYTIAAEKYTVDCSNKNVIKSIIIDNLSRINRQDIIGAIVGDMTNISNVAHDLDGLNLPVLLYDAPNVHTDIMTSIWLTTGHSLQLALAFNEFIVSMKWNRVAVISEDTPTANNFIEQIKEVANFLYLDHSVKLNLTLQDAKIVLEEIKTENGHIILVNTNYNDATTILRAAVELEMNIAEHFTWILRDWRPNNKMMELDYFTISFQCWDTKVEWIRPTFRNIMANVWPKGMWPPQVAELSNAILTMVFGFKDLLLRYPPAQDDTHSNDFIQQFEKSLEDFRIKGIYRNLTYKRRSLEEASVFLHEWHHGEPKLLQKWYVNATSRIAYIGRIYHNPFAGRTRPDDGVLRCLWQAKYSYKQICYDTVWSTALIFILLTLFTFIFMKRVLSQYYLKREKKIILDILLRRKKGTASLPTNCLVERSMLEMRQVLGVGQFGSVRLALLRIPRSKPKYVAAKTLRHNQDESELLREACTLAPLNHDNIIRLVGVCIDNQPPTALMEIAFFGDLLQYLRARRYLVNVAFEPGADIDNKEVTYVQAEALTRLARQAASALAYLSQRKIIHRDLRASNCLVDERRSLKLADFGMAREIEACVDGLAEYACKRRGLFPVLWMAPECLKCGVFSTASDIWAFGLLMFELVTLGMRPYGNISPLRVMQLVIAGGKPSMPRDASPQTLITWAPVIGEFNGTYVLRVTETYVSIDGEEKFVSLYWGSDPARAAAILFSTILRYAVGYKKIRLVQGPHHLRQLATNVTFIETGYYNDVVLALSTAWVPERAPVWSVHTGAICGLAGPRLQEFGASNVPAHQQLYVHIAKPFRMKELCTNISRWSFYSDITALVDCGFANSDMRSHLPNLYYLHSNNNSKIETLAERVKQSAAYVQFKEIDRKKLFRILDESDNSFLFVDYAIWTNSSKVSAVQLPSCISTTESVCHQDLESSVAMRAADMYYLEVYAPELLQLAHNFTPRLETLREILRLEGDGELSDEAVCELASNNDLIAHPLLKSYKILALFCKDDLNYKEHKKLLMKIFRSSVTEIAEMFKLPPNSKYKIKIWINNQINCSNANSMKHEINNILHNGPKQLYIGALVGSVPDIKNVAIGLNELDLTVLLYDGAAVDMNSMTTVWLANGHFLHLALALKHFVNKHNWPRVAILSEPTPTAEYFVKMMKEVGDICIQDHTIKLNLSLQEAKKVLKELKSENAYIVFVNANHIDALTILAAAVELKMHAAENYAWILRESQPNNRSFDITYFMISYWCRNLNDLPRTEKEQKNRSPYRDIMNDLWPEGVWPPQTTRFLDAMLTMINGLKHTLLKYPQAQYDTHSKRFNRQFKKSLIDISPLEGVTQDLTYNQQFLEESLMFLEQWQGTKRKLLARWRINGILRTVHVEDEYYNAESQWPNDPTLKCYMKYNYNCYQATCYDWLLIFILVLIICVPPFTVLVFRLVRAHLMKHKKKVVSKLLAQRRLRVATLSMNYLVERSTLEMLNELGSGQFGCVRRALLLVNGTSTYVAVKMLRGQQDESELLREACILASLNHRHIVRLIGVCIDDQPPLLLMEVAFFGDLLQYLEARRYLVDSVFSEPEAEISKEASHVSAEALTGLAQQAASGLAYLALRDIIHRDIRASNCLIDANRTLKLADFGMARVTATTNLEGSGEYACRRRGLFPVRWMAPESLDNGIFSLASDVWALGVLMLELVTLGARPYEHMTPLRVMEFVTAGGEPPVPRNSSRPSIYLVRLCWQREPERRPTAAEVEQFLKEENSALRPALDFCLNGSTDIDSNLGESPVSESLLPLLQDPL